MSVLACPGVSFRIVGEEYGFFFMFMALENVVSDLSRPKLGMLLHMPK